MQAILILAHKDVEHVKRLALKLQRSFAIYIHFDKKLKLTPADQAFFWKNMGSTISQKYPSIGGAGASAKQQSAWCKKR